MKKPATPEMTASAEALAAEILAIEALLTDATIRAGRLMSSIAADGAAHGLNMAYGQKLVTSTVTLAEKLAATREAAIGVHTTAAATARSLGVQVTANNPGQKPPSDAQPIPPLMRQVA